MWGPVAPPTVLDGRSDRPPRCSGRSLPGWSSASDDGQGNMSSGPLYLLGCDVNWPVLEDTVGEQAGVDATVVPIDLLGDGVTGAADESPFTSVLGLVDTLVLLPDELEDVEQEAPTVFSCGVVLRNVRIIIGEGTVGGVDNNADPVVVIPVDGDDKLTEGDGRLVWEVFAPPSGPAGNRRKGIPTMVGAFVVAGDLHEPVPEMGGETQSACG